jgi:hypothetical protein
MKIIAPLGTYEAVAEVCASHLGTQIPTEQSYMLLPGWFLDLDHAHVTEKKAQQRTIGEIESALRTALQKFYALHPDVRRSVEWQVRDNRSTDTPTTRLQAFIDLDGKNTPVNSSDNLELLLRAGLSSFLGVPADTDRLEFESANKIKSARSASDAALSDLNMKNLTPQARDGGAWQKALTVKRCRQLWEIAKREDAPKSFTGGRTGTGRFDDFLTDMIEALGKQDEWQNPASVMNAWRARCELNEWFL